MSSALNPDQQFIQKLKAEHTRHEAFRELVAAYKERLYWHVRKIVLNHDDADDILQNTFVKVWNGLPNFREESSLYTWIYRIATNESLTFLNSRKRKSVLGLNEVSEYLLENLNSDPYFDGDEYERKLQQAVALLPEKQRLVFTMKYFDDIKYQNMAEILDTSVGALKASYHHAVRKIEDFLKSED